MEPMMLANSEGEIYGFTVILLALIMFTAMPLPAINQHILGPASFNSLTTSQEPSVEYVSYAYRLRSNGYAEVTIIAKVRNVSRLLINLEPGYVNGSLTAYSENGTPLYSVVINGSKAVIYTYGLIGTAVIEYLARVANVTEGVVVNAVIHPISRAVVFLPSGAALTYASGNPSIEFINGSIALIYASGGSYKIQFITMPRLSSSLSAGASSRPTRLHGLNFSHWWLPWAVIGIAACIAILLFIIIRRKLTGSWRKFEEFEVVSGLDERDIMILKSLMGGELSLSEISRRVGLNKSVVWRRVNKLMREGLLDRRFSKGRTLYRLTEKGMQALKELGGEGA